MVELSQPREGIPKVYSTPDMFLEAAHALAAGHGPFAIDTERASAFRYDDRAFLIQVRREGAGTYLFAPEGHRDAFASIVSPILSGESWVMHAAHSDFPALNALDMYPGQLFDTEVAGRLVGAARVNLGSMVEHYLDIRLSKNHGAENWSRTPLPESWLVYAALDVEVLIELSEALTIQLVHTGKISVADEEFNAIIAKGRSLGLKHHWYDMKGMSTLKTRRQRAVARMLWERRDKIAREKDLCPSSLLHDKVIIAAAKAPPHNQSDFQDLDGWRGRYARYVRQWKSAVEQANASPRCQWPLHNEPELGAPRSLSTWRRIAPEAAEIYDAIREELNSTADRLEIKPENLLETRVLKNTVWKAAYENTLRDAHAIAIYMSSQGARTWQIEATLSAITSGLAR